MLHFNGRDRPIGPEIAFHGLSFPQTAALLWPPAGRWHVVIDLTGCAHRVRAEVRVVPSPK